MWSLHLKATGIHRIAEPMVDAVITYLAVLRVTLTLNCAWRTRHQAPAATLDELRLVWLARKTITGLTSDMTLLSILFG